jgi:hypothetical protein
MVSAIRLRLNLKLNWGPGVRERVGEGGRNDPNIVCTYELK